MIWADLFQAPAQGNGGVLQREGISGVAVPGSRFVSSPDYASSRYWEAILQRLQGAATSGGASGGLHGTGLVPDGVKAQPGNQVLSTDTENTVTATTDLGFSVAVEDTGDSQEVQVKVTLTIQQSPSPIVQTKTIDLINPGEQQDGHVQQPRPGAVRDPDDRQGRRGAGAGGEEHLQQLRRVPGHLLARLDGGRGDRDRDRRGRPLRPPRWSSRGSRSRGSSAMRRAQEVLLGGNAKQDVVEFAVSLQGRIDDLHRAVDEVAAALARVDRRVDESFSRSALIRYDAYEDTGGHQSASMAILDSARSGIVLTAIQGRDYARVYVKQLDRGRTPIALSPEEQQAVERAMAPVLAENA